MNIPKRCEWDGQKVYHDPEVGEWARFCSDECKEAHKAWRKRARKAGKE